MLDSHKSQHVTITALFVVCLVGTFLQGGLWMAVYTALTTVTAYVMFRLQDGV